MLKGTPIETGYYHFLQRYLVPWLIELKLKPNHITFMGLFTSFLAGIAFAYRPFWGGLLTLLTGLLDTLDGSLARTLGHAKKSGAFLDSVLDRYTEFIIYLGIWCYFYRHGTGTPFISLTILLILFGSLMVSYTRARAESLGVRCLVGLVQRGERIILIGLAGIFNPLVNQLLGYPSSRWLQDILLISILLLLAIGTNITALKRFIHVLNSLRR
ncbi:MAG: CDP-alcohol phosphatidyltransferase family protein [Desulforhabdus sp.]|jgi:CDP-diacylglycerol--glycerol-3-phosphate 3-phosphatidyltransferase|nr:CDP-alcohol phosphatidyltransferase family protein [Desulforhabdus sp.]